MGHEEAGAERGSVWQRLTPQQFSDVLQKRRAFSHTRERAARFVRQALAFADIEYAEALDQNWNGPPGNRHPRNGAGATPPARPRTLPSLLIWEEHA